MDLILPWEKKVQLIKNTFNAIPRYQFVRKGRAIVCDIDDYPIIFSPDFHENLCQFTRCFQSVFNGILR